MQGSFVTWFDPQPGPELIPGRLNSPFDAEPPGPLVMRAASDVMEELRSGLIGPGKPTALLHGASGGKMFGVLVVRDATGRVGFLKAFSGQLDQSWDVEGWAPPVFDRAARAAVEPAGERWVKSLTARVEASARSEVAAELQAARVMLDQTQAALREALKAAHAERRLARHQQRAALQGDAKALERLSRESQRDDVEFQAAKREWRAEREALEGLVASHHRRQVALERLRRIVSQVVSWNIYDCYLFENARGHQLSLRELFAPQVPSSGTGDCAAPKLLVFALKHGLTPLGIAEFWWGAPPPGGGRVEGAFFPACKDKCGRLLSFLLEGVEVEPTRRFQPTRFTDRSFRVLHRGERFIVVEKPAGLLSVPGTDASVSDSMQARVQAAHPGAQLVHRLDVETSGLLLVALDDEAAVRLQQQFIARTVEKRYVAVLEGTLSRDAGVIDLPLRVDLEQRPRQLVDEVHGKPALTTFSVIARAEGRTRVHFFPRTGRTHQLRVHAAHARGLGIPIVGDRLYGRPERRLYLHAERLEFAHPFSGVRVVVESEAPF